MLSRYFGLGLLLVALISATALAEGGFWGTVTYSNCECTFGGGDNVMVQRVGELESEDYEVRCSPCCGYNTETGCPPHTFPPGTYRLWVHLYFSTDSCATVIKEVEHGSELQRVDLVVKGPPDEPNSPGGD